MPSARGERSIRSMENERGSLAEAIEAFEREEAEERVRRHRGDSAALDPARVCERHCFLGTRSARDALGELVDRGRIEAAEAGAMAAALRRHRRCEALAPLRRTVDDLGTRRIAVDGRGMPFGELVEGLFRGAAPAQRLAMADALAELASRAAPAIASRLAEAAEGEAELGRPDLKHPDRPEDPPERLAWELLDATEDVFEETLEWLIRDAEEGASSWAALAPRLRASLLDDAIAPHGRLERLAHFAEHLGWARALRARVRVEAPSGGASIQPRARVIVPGSDVRILAPALELGCITEAGMAEAVGLSLSLAVAHPALPSVLRRLGPSSVARAVGALCISGISPRKGWVRWPA